MVFYTFSKDHLCGDGGCNLWEKKSVSTFEWWFPSSSRIRKSQNEQQIMLSLLTLVNLPDNMFTNTHFTVSFFYKYTCSDYSCSGEHACTKLQSDLTPYFILGREVDTVEWKLPNNSIYKASEFICTADCGRILTILLILLIGPPDPFCYSLDTLISVVLTAGGM